MADLPADVVEGLQDRLDAALQFTQQTGEILKHYFEGHAYDVEDKADGSPVTTADRETEAAIRRAIQQRWPQDGLIGEEYAADDAEGTSGFRWVIDPIDGTIAFVHGVPTFGTLIGIEYQGQPLAGVMDLPLIQERAWARRGTGAWYRRGDQTPRLVEVSTTNRLDEAMVCTTSFDYYRDHGFPDAYVALGLACRRTRGWNDCFCELLLCTGRIDAVVEPELKRWDIAAIVPILLEAGGRYTDWSGQGEGDPGSTRGLASNGRLHDALLAVLAPF